jgi:plasmid stabilization system protein ParE
MTEYVLSKDADLDLDEIREYTAQDNIDAAGRWIAKLFRGVAAIGRALHRKS